MGGVFLLIAYSYRIQKETEAFIEAARTSVNHGKEMENELTALKGLTYIFLGNKSDRWLDSLKHHKKLFTIHLERARIGSKSFEENLLIQQLSGLFGNYEQNILTARKHLKNNDITKANALLLHSAKDLLETIQRKNNEYIIVNTRTERLYENELTRTNAIVLRILTTLGIGGIAVGLLFGWLITRLLFGPINQLILTVRSASGQAVLEEVRLNHTNDFNELEESIKNLIGRINRANEDLTRSRMLLQHSNKYAALGKIAPTIAHEIRNPLAAIKMLVYSIREEGGISPSVKDDLDIISGEINRLEKFTKDFLRFAKPSDPVFEVANPMESLGEVMQLLKPRFKESRIAVNEVFNAEKCSVLADSDQLKQIFLNIMLNAINIMPNGGTLTIQADIVEGRRNPTETGIRTCICIKFLDTGPGIPEAILCNLFEPYIRKSDMGVGIGLSISQSIAESHGGWIDAQNRPGGEGAMFAVFIPTRKVE